MARRPRPSSSGAGRARDPWERAPVGELQEQLLPRWFVLTAIAMVPLAIAVGVAAWIIGTRGEVPVAERRPAPGGGLTSEVGSYALGPTEPRPYDGPCPDAAGLRIAGEAEDISALTAGLDRLCAGDLPAEAAAGLARLTAGEAVVRFAAFTATGVDVTSTLVDAGDGGGGAGGGAEGDEPLVLVNGRFVLADPRGITPLVASEAVYAVAEAGTAEAALTARRVELAVCDALYDAEEEPSRSCRDAAELLDLDDPLAALRAAGFE